MNNVFIRYTAVLILGISWVIAWQHVLYAATLPGDAFTGAIFLLIPLMLQYVVLDRRQGMEKIPVHIFFRCLLVGLSLVFLLFCLPLMWGKALFASFKISVWGHKVSSTVLLETGFFLIVVGVVAFALITFKEPD